MFGHDDKNDQQHNDNGGAAPVISPADNQMPADNSHSPAAVGGAPAFDTSNVSLDSSHDSTPAPAPSSTDDEKDDDLLAAPGGGKDDLIAIKQDALHELSPLVGHLDQSPEEKFRTTMMMIQASDDQSLVKTAYAAAKDIKDDKVRAQALLDIINEINYFTQQHSS